MMRSRFWGPAIGLSAAALISGCGAASSTASSAPPLNILGGYPVAWSIRYYAPDDDIQSATPRSNGGCSGSIVITSQTAGGFGGRIVTTSSVQPPCHAATFELHGTMSRNYFEDYGIDNGWDLSATSDVEPLLGCSFVSVVPGNTGDIHGSGNIDPEKRISLAFEGVYVCPSGRWKILASAATPRL
jgi:hypothetical protein